MQRGAGGSQRPRADDCSVTLINREEQVALRQAAGRPPLLPPAPGTGGWMCPLRRCWAPPGAAAALAVPSALPAGRERSRGGRGAREVLLGGSPSPWCLRLRCQVWRASSCAVPGALPPLPAPWLGRAGGVEPLLRKTGQGLPGCRLVQKPPRHEPPRVPRGYRQPGRAGAAPRPPELSRCCSASGREAARWQHAKQALCNR